MSVFTYKAKNKEGKTVGGRVEAAKTSDAARVLREQGLVIIKLTPQRESLLGFLRRFTNRVTLSDTAVFTRQFSTMITAGLPITDALLIIRSQSRPSLRPVVAGILADVEGGSSLAVALSKYPKVFSPVYIALVRAGEEGGVLDKVLLRLADNLESQREFTSKVKGAMIYPAIVVAGMMAVGAVMMLFVVPRLTSLYSEFQAELPFATKVLISTSGLFTRFWWLVPGGTAGLVWGLGRFAATSAGRTRIDNWKLKLPVFGTLQRQIILTEFTRTLGLLVGAGISILEGLRIVSGVVGNVIVSDALARASSQVEKGFSLAYALSQDHEVFPPMLFQMIAVGEETGKLDETLLKTSKVFEQESEQAVRGLTSAIEPLIMIVLGIGVAFLVIAIIMPIYNLTSKF